ncbi:protein kinase A regulatory subunit [Metarhizium acridum]|uniref:cAMP-dependent protein kinase regulatory subunit n=1 Tax=Metarhizium acridum (strain CQMa 102) TaxID=655827 RepID=E9DXG2_METAQ|nr:cAMP-dependent protein kinase regulatory subunit [Metarhizium acridum CQMa 102]EFY91720.1 cAMP-dependent protein kinase regulatory subunit [Metarhizium acridum CQMa 102]KAG8420866.1 protein kinase A regulatory subunit [Metarhizium acridum]
MSVPFSSPFGANANPFGNDRSQNVMHSLAEEDENDNGRNQNTGIGSGAGITFPGTFGGDASTDTPPTVRGPPHPDSYPAQYNFARRTSVSAESLKPSADSYDNWSPPFHEKTADQLERLKRAIEGNFLFSHLDEEQTAQILGALVEKPIPAKGIKVISQGDAGDFFYVVEKGSFDVHVNPSGTIQPGPDGLGEKVGNIQAGGSFGELALMYNAPRAATVISVEPNCTLWALDRITFRRILMESTFARRRMYETFLEEVPLLSSLTPYERSKIADALETKKYAPGEIIIKEGDPGHSFFLLESGEADAFKGEPSNKVLHYKKGDFFGELALLNDQPRAASIMASTEVKVATLGKNAFQRLLGPVEGILRRTRYEGVATGVEEMDPLHRD